MTLQHTFHNITQYNRIDIAHPSSIPSSSCLFSMRQSPISIPPTQSLALDALARGLCQPEKKGNINFDCGPDSITYSRTYMYPFRGGSGKVRRRRVIDPSGELSIRPACAITHERAIGRSELSGFPGLRENYYRGSSGEAGQ